MLIVPLSDTYAQTVAVTLGGQPCQLTLKQKATGFYLDLTVSGATVLVGVICQNINRVVRDRYLGFVGDLAFWDTEGADDPRSPGLGTRFQLLYLEAADLAGVGG